MNPQTAALESLKAIWYAAQPVIFILGVWGSFYFLTLLPPHIAIPLCVGAFILFFIALLIFVFVDRYRYYQKYLRKK